MNLYCDDSALQELFHIVTNWTIRGLYMAVRQAL